MTVCNNFENLDLDCETKETEEESNQTSPVRYTPGHYQVKFDQLPLGKNLMSIGFYIFTSTYVLILVYNPTKKNIILYINLFNLKD